MTPLYFGTYDRQLFGIFQAGSGRASGAKAVLLCNPYGQEAVRAHRMYRVLADRLARAGYDVLRFDYFATGDSAGEDALGEMTGWIADIKLADAELRRRSSAEQIIWVGTRLGATLAVEASAGTSHPPDKLILWETIVDGTAYLQQLRERFVQTLELSFDVPDPPWREMLSRGEFDLAREGVGFEVGGRLSQQLAQLSSASLPMPGALHCDVIEQEHRPAITDKVQGWMRYGLTVNVSSLAHDFDWLAPEALSTALVPAQAIQLLTQRITTPG